MTASTSIDLTDFLDQQLAQASPDLLRQMLKAFAEALMSADADGVCGAGYNQRSQERTNSRNGYRERRWDTRAGSIDLAIPRSCARHLFPAVAAGAAQAGRGGAGQCGGHQLPAGGVDPAGGETRGQPGHHRVVQVAGLGHGR